MKKVKAFFYIFRKSFIPNASYYKKIIKTPFIFSFKYFISLILFLNIILLAHIINNLVPFSKVNNFLDGAIESLKGFPKQLVILKKDNYLLTTLDRPYFFWITTQKDKIPLIVINEVADNNFLYQTKTSFIFTKQHFVVKLPNNTILYQLNLEMLNDFYFDKDKANQMISFLEKINKNLFLIYFLIMVFLFLFLFLITIVVNFIYLLISSLLVYLYFKIGHKKHYHYKKILQIACHAITFILVSEYLFFLLPFPIRLTNNQLISLTPIMFILTSSLLTGTGVWIAHNNH